MQVFAQLIQVFLIFQKNKVYFIPNPLDPSLENMEIYKNKNLDTDVFFCYVSWST